MLRGAVTLLAFDLNIHILRRSLPLTAPHALEVAVIAVLPRPRLLGLFDELSSRRLQAGLLLIELDGDGVPCVLFQLPLIQQALEVVEKDEDDECD